MKQNERPDAQINKRKPKSGAERMKMYRDRKRQNKTQTILNADRKKMQKKKKNIQNYRAKRQIARIMTQEFENKPSSNQSSSQDRSVIHANDSIICDLLPSTPNILSQPNEAYNFVSPLPMITQPNQENILIKNGYGNACTYVPSSNPNSINENMLQNTIKEENTVNVSQEYQRTLRPRAQIKVEPLSDDDVDVDNIDDNDFEEEDDQSSLAEESGVIDYTNECVAYGKYIEQKLKNFSQKTRNAVQHAFSDIIYKASQRLYE